MILHIGKYADPELIGSNRLLSEQVFGLKARGYPVEVLTWPQGDGWTREEASLETGMRAGHPYLSLDIKSVLYHVINPPRVWGLRWITDEENRAAVQYASALLRALGPEQIHFHYWQSMWWFLDAAIDLGIPVIYTAYDYGLPCAQITLVMGDRQLCDTTADIEKCSQCTRLHPSLKGKLNEWILDLPGAGKVVRTLTGPSGIGPLRHLEAMRISARDRVEHAIGRSRRILPQMNGMIVTTPFAARFFKQFGVTEDKLDLLPWFYSQSRLNNGPAQLSDDGEVVLAYVGRLSPEKGVHLLLEALERVKSERRLKLKLTGTLNSEYAKRLRGRYPERAGPCKVEWVGWVDNELLPDFYQEVHLAIFPSTWYDNCPTTLIEALAHRKFIICSDVPTMAEFVTPDQNALLFKRGDIDDLAGCLERFLGNIDTYLQSTELHDTAVRSREEYLDELEKIYQKRFFSSSVE